MEFSLSVITTNEIFPSVIPLVFSGFLVVLTHHRHWQRVDPHAVAGEDQQTGGSGSSLSSLPVRTGGGSLQSNPTTQAVDFTFVFLFSFRSAIISLH
jgi:hypothetical protein